jgi:hypothetical protein
MTYNLSLEFFTDQNDIVPDGWWELIYNNGGAYTLAGNDQIIGTAQSSEYSGRGLINDYNGIIDTGNGRDTITGAAWPTYGGPSIYNLGSIETGNDADYISTYTTVGWSENRPTYYGSLDNYGTVSLGDGNNVLDAMVDVTYEPIKPAIYNFGTIQAGIGDDTITSNTGIYNDGFINTGNGNDVLITYGNRGFDGSGNVFLGYGEDYLKGFGSGYYYGGNDQDSLHLTPGYYTIGVGGGGVSFSSSDWPNETMQTFEFEKLIVSGTTYDFTSLYDGMTVSVW